MDAVKFIEGRNRMCKSFFDGCKGCPASNVCEDDLCCAVGQESTLDATAQIAIVEEWSAAHPRKTRQSVFLEQYPEAEIDKCGRLMLCPKLISADCRDRYGNCSNRICSDCRREFWMQEVE
jgi:hypothetical protein